VPYTNQLKNQLMFVALEVSVATVVLVVSGGCSSGKLRRRRCVCNVWESWVGDWCEVLLVVLLRISCNLSLGGGPFVRPF